MFNMIYGSKKFSSWLAILAISMTFLISCAGSSTSSGAGSSASSSTSNSGAVVSMPPQTQNSAASSSQTQGQNEKSSQANTDQYLVKTLKVSMQVKDTRKVANELQSWISSADTRSISSGTDYEQVDNNSYTVNLTFSVQSSLYPHIYTYLRDYTSQNGGHLSGFTETVQNVTGDYIDTQSRLKTLHTEQARLLDLMNHAQAMGDIVTIEQKLTDVEGQIETYEGRLKNLANQVSFYTVQISLEPISLATPPPTEPAWSIGQVFQQAFAASIVFAQVLLTFLIWLFAFVWYAIPVIVIIWLIKRFKFRFSKIMPIAATAQKNGVK